MAKSHLICLLALLLMLPTGLAEIDTTSYLTLVSEIDAKQVQLDEARAASDWDAVLVLNQELKPLENRLIGTEMRFLSKYSKLKLFLDESNYLVEQINTNLPGEATSAAVSDFNALSQSFGQLDPIYNSQNYDGALSLLEDIEKPLILIPTSLISSSANEGINLKSLLSSDPQIPASAISMVDDARGKFSLAEAAYNAAATLYPNSNAEDISGKLNDAHSLSSEGYSLVSRAKTEDNSLFESIKWVLMLGPILLIIALIIYFKTQFKKTAMLSTVSKKVAPGGTKSTVERHVVVTNMESEPISVTLSDVPPKALEISDFNTAPTRVYGNELAWDFTLPVGLRKTISYTLNVPALDSGWQLKIPGAKLVYNLGEKQKEVSGKDSTIKIE